MTTAAQQTDTAGWEARRNRLVSRKGGWHVGGGVHASGYLLLDDLLGQQRLTDVVYLHVKGSLPDPRFSRWIEGVFICLAFPDPRIWCNHISALGANSGCTPTAAIATGTMAGDSSLYGPGSVVLACAFLLDAAAALDAGQSLEEFMRARRLGGKRGTPGFARPIAHGDDRVVALQRLAADAELPPGRFTRIAEQIGEAIGGENGNAMNMLGLCAGFLMDNGMSPEEIRRVFSLCVMAGTHACYSEAADNPRGSFLPLRCDDIEYTGAEPRHFPSVESGA